MISLSRVVLLLATTSAYELHAGVSPVQKVLQLMQDMVAKGKQEKHEETVRFSSFSQWCQDTSAEKASRISDANDEIEQLQAAIQQAESDAAQLARDIAELDEDINGWESDKKGAAAIREQEHKDFLATQKDYGESIDALERAIQVLKQQNFDRKQATALLQEVASMSRVPEKAKRVLSSFLMTDSEVKDDPLSVSAPEANAYEFQSGGVIEMLEKLHDKFDDELNTLQSEEMKARHAFEMMTEDLVNSIAAATAQRDAKAKTKAQREQDAAGAKGDLSDTTASRDEDSTYLKDMKAQCEQKSTDFAARQQLRAEELEAIEKAIQIIAGQSVSGAADKHLPSLLQKRASLLQSFLANGQRSVQRNVAAFLQGRAEKLQSRILSLVATKVADDPFVKVKKMIKDMITRLLEEANEEAEHKGWCDTEMATNKKTRDHKSETVETLTAEADKLSADIARLAQQIADLTDAIAEIDAAVAKATSERAKEKKTNEATIEDAQDAQTAVAQAMAVLKDFYAKAATATALVQQTPASDAPETFDAPYRGMSDTSGGVVGMLEVINSDFARLEAETTSAEAEAAKAHGRFLAESSKDKAVKTTDLDYKSNTKTQKESDLADTKKDLAGTQRELEAALHYYEKLKPSCVDAVMSFDERTSRRQEEIESLQEALKILSGDDMA